NFAELHLNDLDIGGLHNPADEARFDGKFTVAAIDQNQELHARRTAVIKQRVKRGADRAAGVEHVIHEDDILALHGKRNIGAAHDGLDVYCRKVVAIEIDIEDADRDLALLERLDFRRQPLRHRDAAAANAYEGELVKIGTFFENFVGQADERTVDFRCAHQLSL